MMVDRVLGITDLLSTFKRLDNQLSKNTALRMVAAAGNVIKKEAKSIAQSKGLKRTGSLIRNIVIKREKQVADNTVQYNVGVRHGRAFGNRKNAVKFLARNKKSGRVVVKYKNDPYYWRFLEFGHKTVARNTGQTGGGQTKFVTTLRNGKKANRTRAFSNASITGRRRNSTGFVQPKPFLGPALERKQVEAINAMNAQLQKDILNGKI